MYNDVTDDGTHPMNRKVKLTVKLSKMSLTERAKRRLLMMVEERYDPKKDEIVIVCRRYPSREENMDHIQHIMTQLLEAANAEDSVRRK